MENKMSVAAAKPERAWRTSTKQALSNPSDKWYINGNHAQRLIPGSCHDSTLSHWPKSSMSKLQVMVYQWARVFPCTSFHKALTGKLNSALSLGYVMTNTEKLKVGSHLFLDGRQNRGILVNNKMVGKWMIIAKKHDKNSFDPSPALWPPRFFHGLRPGTWFLEPKPQLQNYEDIHILEVFG